MALIRSCGAVAQERCALHLGAELSAVTGAADQLIPLLVTFEELLRGPRSITEAKRLREEGGWCFKIWLVTDAMSLFQAVATMKAK